MAFVEKSTLSWIHLINPSDLENSLFSILTIDSATKPTDQTDQDDATKSESVDTGVSHTLTPSVLPSEDSEEIGDKKDSDPILALIEEGIMEPPEKFKLE